MARVDEALAATTPRQAEFALKLRDAVNAVVVQYPDVANPGALLGCGMEMLMHSGASREQVHELVDRIWYFIEEFDENKNENMAVLEARAGAAKKN